jgi:hypothetical protein
MNLKQARQARSTGQNCRQTRSLQRRVCGEVASLGLFLFRCSDGCTLLIRSVHAMSCPVVFYSWLQYVLWRTTEPRGAVRPPARITRLPFFDVNLLTPPLVGIRQTQTVESTPRTPQYVFT